MPDTFIKIASVTVGSGGAASIDFTSIPSTYTDLCVKLSVRISQATSANNITLSLNSSTSTFSSKLLYGTGSAAASASQSNNNFIDVQGSTSTANTFTSVDLYLPNYAGSNNKSISTDAVTENNATAAYAEMWATLWSTSSAITSIGFTAPAASTFTQYSTATLYGIKNS